MKKKSRALRWNFRKFIQKIEGRNARSIILLLIVEFFIISLSGCAKEDEKFELGGGGSNLNIDVQQSAFQSTLYPVLRDYCKSCHASQGPGGTPDFAHEDLATAYSVITSNSLVSFTTPSNSRLVTKVLGLHKCTEPTCGQWANAIIQAVVNWNNLAPPTGSGGSNGINILSSSLTLADSVLGGGGGRVEDAVIAKYTFKEGSGNVVNDVSNVSPALNLSLSGDVVGVPGQGIDVTDPNNAQVSVARGTSANSKKLYDLIAGPNGSKEYTIEAWVINDSTALDGPARIVTYSLNATNRNFMMGQVTSYYSFRNRSNLTGSNGSSPALETDNNGGALKTELQHLVFTFDQTNGRNIYINGVKPAYEVVDSDPAVPSDISNWNDTYTFALGNEIPDSVRRQWLGKILFVAIHNRALTAAEALKNTQQGIGDKYLLDFDVTPLLDASGNSSTKIRMVVSELDAYSYVFGTPAVITTLASPNFPVKNIRIAVNGNIPSAAQAFTNVDTIVTANNFELSPLGSVIPKDSGAEFDQFTLVLDVLGNHSHVVIEENPPVVVDTSANDPVPDHGVRTFEQINNTMSVLTGVDSTATQSTFDELRQQLPSTPYLGSFVSANQIGVAKLSLDYCDNMVESSSLRRNFFGSNFDFTAATSIAFGSQTQRDIIINALVSNMIGDNISRQPSLAEIKPDLEQLIDELTANCNVATDCNAARTRTVVKAACAAVLGSAAVLVD